MSGGYFGYPHIKVENFYDDLNEAIYTKELELEGETIVTLKDIARRAKYLAELMQGVDLLYSSDISEKTFMETVKEIDEEFVKEKNLRELKPCSISEYHSGSWVKCTESGLPAKVYHLLQGNRMDVAVYDTSGKLLYVEEYFSDGTPVSEGEPLRFPGIKQ